MSADAELVIGPTRWNVDWRRVGYIFCPLTLNFGSCLATEILYALYLLLDTVLRLANRDSLGSSQSSD